MKKHIFLGLISLAGVFVITSCNSNTNDITNEIAIKGEDGNGIVSITKTNTEGIVDTYTITYTNGTTSTFSVTNGLQGIQGIQGPKGENGNSSVITIGANGNWFINGVDTNQPSKVKGDTGNGISKIELTNHEGKVDTYTITYTNGTTSTFTVTNGENGVTPNAPSITIGANGNWFIDGVDTNVKASTKGNGIASIIKSNSVGLVDTYTITYSDGTTSSFEITNGKNNDDALYNSYKKNHPEYTGDINQFLDDLISGALTTKTDEVTFVVDGAEYTSKNVEHGYGVEKPSDPTKDGYIFDGWYAFGQQWDFITNVVNMDIELEAEWILDSFNLTTDGNDGGSFTAINANYAHGTEVELTATPNLGYNFVGWYNEDELVSSDCTFTYETTTTPTTLTAKFEEMKYKVTYVLPDGAKNPNVEYFTTNSTIALKNATLDGYSMVGWYSDSGYTNQITNVGSVKQDTTIYGKMRPNTYKLTLHTSVKHTITFDHNYDSKTEVKTIYTGDTLTPPQPTRSGYIFQGWYTDSSCTNRYNFGTVITEDFTLYAKWQVGNYTFVDATQYNMKINAYSIYLPGNVSTTTTKSFAIVCLEAGTHHLYFPYKTSASSYGSVMVRNLTQGKVLQESTALTNSKDLQIFVNAGDVIYFECKNGSNDCTILFYFSGFQKLETSTCEDTIVQNIKYGSTIDFKNPEKEGMTFDGFVDSDSMLYNSSTYDVAGNLELWAQFN